MQGTAARHHALADALLPQANPVFADATALHTAVDIRDPEPTLVERLVRPLVLPRQLLAVRLLRWHADRHLRERARQEAESL